jgi:hypothetical protein
MHRPPLQNVLAGQMLPQALQLQLSLKRSLQAKPPGADESGQHWKFVPSVVGQALVHVPQLRVVVSDVHWTPVPGDGTAQQPWFTPQAFPQEAQLVVVPRAEHVPAVQQGSAVGHALPHVLQLAGSVWRFLQCPEQQFGVAVGQQAKLTGATPVPPPPQQSVTQLVLQAPQLAVVFSTTQVPLQQWVPRAQVLQGLQLRSVPMGTQVLPLQQAVAPVQQKKSSLSSSSSTAWQTWAVLPHARHTLTHSPSSSPPSARQRIRQAALLGPWADAFRPSPRRASRVPPAKPPAHFSASRRVRAPARPLASSSNRFPMVFSFAHDSQARIAIQ